MIKSWKERGQGSERGRTKERGSETSGSESESQGVEEREKHERVPIIIYKALKYIGTSPLF